MKFTYKKLILCIAILAFVGTVCYGVYVYFPNKRYEDAFSQIKVGDSKEKVISTFGRASRIENCLDKSDDCAEIYFYTAFLEEWGLVFNKEGKLTDKFHEVSQ